MVSVPMAKGETISPERPKRTRFIAPYDLPNQKRTSYLQDLVPLQTADHAARLIMAGNIGWIAGNDVAHDLRNGVIALGLQGMVDIHEDILRLIARFLNWL